MRRIVPAVVLAAALALGGGIAVASPHPTYVPPIGCEKGDLEYAVGTGPLVLAYICPGVPGHPFTVTDSVPDVVKYEAQANGRVKVTATPRGVWTNVRHSVTVRYQ